MLVFVHLCVRCTEFSTKRKCAPTRDCHCFGDTQTPRKKTAISSWNPTSLKKSQQLFLTKFTELNLLTSRKNVPNLLANGVEPTPCTKKKITPLPFLTPQYVQQAWTPVPDHLRSSKLLVAMDLCADGSPTRERRPAPHKGAYRIGNQTPTGAGENRN